MRPRAGSTTRRHRRGGLRFFGVWAFAVALNFGYLDGLASALVSLVAVGCMLGLIAWQRRVRGTYPSGRAPREFRTSFIVLFGGALVVSLAAWLVGTAVAPWVGAVVAGLGAGALVAWYERSYARAAARVRARLG